MGFNIKGMKPNFSADTRQGYYDISESRKYKGVGPCIFRSGWEQQFMQYCDRNDQILWWSSEAFSIPYHNPFDGKDHHYYPDFILRLADGSTIIAEVKPKFRLRAPAKPKRKGESVVRRYERDLDTFRTNMLKIRAAKEYAARRGMRYLLVTEDFFKPSHA